MHNHTEGGATDHKSRVDKCALPNSASFIVVFHKRACALLKAVRDTKG